MQGGVGDFTREIGMALNGLGATVSAVSSIRASQSSMAPRSSHDGVTIRSNGLRLTLFPVVERWGFSSWSQVTEVLRHTSSEILNVQYQTAAYQMHPAVNFLPWRLRLLRDRPGIVTTFHDLKLPYLFPKAGAVRRWVTSALISGSDATIVTNVEDRLGAEAYAPRSLHLFPIGSNIDPQAPPGYDRAKWRERWGVRPEETLLCYFGFLNESKGGETLFRSLARLVASGERVKLLMIGGRVGSSDPTNVAYLQEMEALVDELGIADHVSWTDYVDAPEVSASFWSSDICVLPYRDGASFRRGTLMAALAHGVPIVSTYPRVEVAEIVENENMGLVPPDDDEALADKISQVAASPQLRERLAKGAAGLANLFSWKGIAQNTMTVYEEVLADRA
jgi:glycosyltransferase involved in cell wall biosynthesis